MAKPSNLQDYLNWTATALWFLDAVSGDRGKKKVLVEIKAAADEALAEQAKLATGQNFKRALKALEDNIVAARRRLGTVEEEITQRRGAIANEVAEKRAEADKIVAEAEKLLTEASEARAEQEKAAKEQTATTKRLEQWEARLKRDADALEGDRKSFDQAKAKLDDERKKLDEFTKQFARSLKGAA